jgi:hypothetical protein
MKRAALFAALLFFGHTAVANSHWKPFDRENRLPDDLGGPVILKLDLGQRMP